MRLVWGARGLADPRIIDCIGNRNLDAAVRLRDAIARTAEQLPDHPFLHRPGRRKETREALVHPSCVLAYRIGDEVATVLAIVHSRRNHP